jgi:hypothetical protein
MVQNIGWYNIDITIPWLYDAYIAKCIYYTEILLSLIEELTRFGQLAARVGGPQFVVFWVGVSLGGPGMQELGEGDQREKCRHQTF